MATITRKQTPGLVFQPQTRQGLIAGVRQINAAIRPTLGPLPRCVGIENPIRNKAPEILDKGALIARRITDLKQPDADVGAMLLRHMLWKQYEIFGDGTATTALLFESIFTDCNRYLTAGYDAQSLRRHLLSGLAIVQRNLKSETIALEGGDQLEQIAASLCTEERLPSILSEIFDTLGVFGKIGIQRGYGRATRHEFTHGVMWDGGIHGPELLFDKMNARSLVADAAVFLSDFDFDDPRDLVPIIEAAHHKARALVIICRQLSSRGIGLLSHINKKRSTFKVIAVMTPTDIAKQLQMLEETTLMTGARAYLQGSGDTIENLIPDHLGHITEAWANNDYFCITDDRDQGKSRSSYLLKLHEQYQSTTDQEAKHVIRERIGHLMGAASTIMVGGASESEVQSKTEHIDGAVKTLRSALESGVVFGGGVALLNCQSALHDKLSTEDDGAMQAAYLSLIKALEQPFRQICVNAGYDPGLIRQAIVRSNMANCGYDARSDRIVDMIQAGILDSVELISFSLTTAVRTAALAQTIDVIVHHRHPEYSNTP